MPLKNIGITITRLLALPLALFLAACQSNQEVGLRAERSSTIESPKAAETDGEGVGLRSEPRSGATVIGTAIQPGENTNVGTIGWINRDNGTLLVKLNANYADLGSFLAVRDDQGRYTAILKPGMVRGDNTSTAEILEGYPSVGQQVIVPNAKTLEDISSMHQ